jgi:hypothetical protein
LLLSTPLLAQAPKKAPIPLLPTSASAADKNAYNRAAQLLSRNAFDEGATLVATITPQAVTKVWIDWTPVSRGLRAGYKTAIQASIDEWNKGLAGSVSFTPALKEEEADLLVLFERSVMDAKVAPARAVCQETVLESRGGRRTGAIILGLNIPSSLAPHSPTSIGHLMAQGLGEFLGLAPTLVPGDGAMNPDLHSGATALKIAAAELGDAKALIAARIRLADLAKRKVAVYLPLPKIAVDKMKMDAGDVWRGEQAHYVFMVKNTGDAPLEIEAKPTCGCTIANYDKVIPPKGEGKIEANMATATFRGKVTKGIEVKSNDVENPTMSLQLLANVKSIVSVTPSENPVFGLKSGEATTQELQVKIDSTEPVQLTRVTCSANYATAKFEPVANAGSGSTYKVTVTIDPAAPMGRSAFLISAFTSSKKEPQVNLTAICEKGVIVMPPSAYLGAIGPNSVLPLNQFLTLSRREGGVHIQKVENDDPKLEVKQTTMKDGQQYQLQITYKGGWPTGVITRKIVVYTDDPAQPRIEIPVLANVLAAAPAAPVGPGK